MLCVVQYETVCGKVMRTELTVETKGEVPTKLDEKIKAIALRAGLTPETTLNLLPKKILSTKCLEARK